MLGKADFVNGNSVFMPGVSRRKEKNMIALNPDKFSQHELRILRTFFAKLGASITKRCPHDKVCSNCEYVTLCNYARDCFIVCNKELQRR